MRPNKSWLLLVLIFSACASVSTAPVQKHFSLNEIRTIPLSLSSADVIARLGKPGEKYDLPDHEVSLLYFDPTTEYQTLDLVFDSQNRLSAKIYLTHTGEAEYDMAVLVQKSFADEKFETVKRQQCLDYYKPDLLVNRAKGIIIEAAASDWSKSESVVWAVPDRFDRILKRLVECSRRKL